MTERPTLTTTAGAPVATTRTRSPLALAVRFSWRVISSSRNSRNRTASAFSSARPRQGLGAFGALMITSDISKYTKDVVESAEAVVRTIVETCFAPNKTFPELRELMNSHAIDPLRAFSEICRAELRALKGLELALNRATMRSGSGPASGLI